MHALSMPAEKVGGSGPDGMFQDDSHIRVIFLVRLILSCAGLLILGQAQFVAGVHGTAGEIVLGLFVLYSLGLYAMAVLSDIRMRGWRWHWLDTAWGLGILAASGGGDSVFHLFFLFPVLWASTVWSAREGRAVLVFSVMSALAVGVAQTLPAPPWPLVLSRAMLLAMVGYAIVHWSGVSIQQKRRLVLLQNLNRVPNPRFGPARLIEATLERLRDFYQADTCLAVLRSTEASCVYMAEKGHSGTSLKGDDVAELALKLLGLADPVSVCVAPGRFPQQGARMCFDGVGGEPEGAVRTAVAELSNYLDGGAWVSVPLLLRGESAGRLYVLSKGVRFDRNDMAILRQAGEHLMPLVETVQLLDGLATQAASKERGRLSLDMHDVTIQPYLGLKLGLESLRRKALPGNPLLPDLDELFVMTNDSIADLRRYLRGLKGSHAAPLSPLLDGVQKQVDQFFRLYGIETELNCAPDLYLNDRLTAEVLPMVGESLSNIGRHTRSRRVTLNLQHRGESFICQTVNHGAKDAPPWKPFTPVSLSRRAEQLGGRVMVDRLPDNGSVVSVEIPL